jgi:hypothetical protein
VGEPLREAERLGVPAPNLRMAYGMLKCLQWKTKEKRGLVTLPPKEDPRRPMLEMVPGSHVPT